MCLLFLSSSIILAQYTPIGVTGFNHDVIADGASTSSLVTTTTEMDAAVISNHVLCTKTFAATNGFPATYGLPDNLLFTSGANSYQVPVTGNNALYLLTSETGTLTLGTPAMYSSISLLVTATEGTTTLSITANFTDATTAVLTTSIADWWIGTTGTIINQGTGRIQRKNGPFTATDYDNNLATSPRIFTVNLNLPCGKTLSSLTFKNTTSAVVTGSTRAFVFAVSGIAGAPLVTPITTSTPVCSAGGTSTLTVTNPQVGLTYTWYAVAFGGVAVGTGSTFTTPAISANTNYYVVASSGTCATSRLSVPVTLSSPPAAPTATANSVCPGSTAIVTIASPVTGATYNLYTAATGGTPIGTSTTGTITTPIINAGTTYYVEAITSGGCPSVRSAVNINLLTPFLNPVVTPTNIGTNFIIFSWGAVVGANGYEVSVNGGAYGVPSTGSTGLSHTVSGLVPNTIVNITVRTLVTNLCQQSSGSAFDTTVTDQVFIPNVFTPNNDGKNDVLLVFSNITQSLHFQVFNQWGEKVFETDDKSIGWTGTYKGKQQPSGVYIYTLRLVTTAGLVIERKGSVTLVR